MKVKTLWECAECGNQQAKWAGCCAQCKAWNSFVEVEKMLAKKMTVTSKKEPVFLQNVSLDRHARISSSIASFDHVMGGGVVPGCFSLLAGYPGIGKSTLLLQLACSYLEKGKKVLYVCGEESLEQTALRSKRLGLKAESLLLLHETNVLYIREAIEASRPDIVMVDSMQILYHPEIPSSPGSVAQVRENAFLLMQLAKERKMALFLVGHVTKTGDIAGPKVLEHIVDVVLEFEGEKSRGFRMVRSKKNRFGSTDEMALFQMQKTGLHEVKNPAQIFMEERQNHEAGCVITCAIDGGCALYIQLQALVTHSVFQNPMRKHAGIDASRFTLLLAVLEKKVGFRLHTSDVFVSTVGGVKITEPAIDLAILCAIASSFSGKKFPANMLILGEVGLTGEVRCVSHLIPRVKEAQKLGFSSCLCAKKDAKQIESLCPGLTLYSIQKVEQAMSYFE